MYYKGKNSDTYNHSYIRALIDANSILYPHAPEDILTDMVNNDHTVYEPNILEA